MCGIFGVSSKLSLQNNLDKIKHDINLFIQNSEIRGSDTFGISIKTNNQNCIYKTNEKPTIAIKRDDYSSFLSEYLKNEVNENIQIIGQTRLVTNGSKFSYQNNQPLISKNIIGVHNGIFTNLEKINEDKTINYESYNVKSDSLTFFEKLSDFADKKNFIDLYLSYLKKIIGNYSISFFVKNENKIYISSNCGTLYYYYDGDFFCFGSERKIVENYIKQSILLHKKKIDFNKIKKCLNETIIYNQDKFELLVIDHNSKNFNPEKFNIDLNKVFKIKSNLNYQIEKLKNLKKCSRCILPETYPFIKFNENNVCNYCLDYQKQEFYGEKKLNEYLESFRSKNGKVDCIVGLSGGRDSCYGLHLLKTQFRMNPIAFTYDWGLTTDISRLNASILCGKLGVEHIIRSADIEKKRKYVRQNIFAWLKDPHLGMLPIVQAGDKDFMEFSRTLCKELNVEFCVQATGYQLEQREFFLGFAGIQQKLKDNQRMSSYSLMTKLRMFFWYSYRTLKNPSYINEALMDNFNGYVSSFIKKENFLYLYKYIKWDEKKMSETLENEYGWISDKSYGKNQWRMGDGQTAFNNFVYYQIAGFSEYDNFRSNQIREGLINRDEAVKLCKEDNRTRFDTLKNFSEIIGFNLDEVLTKIICLPKLY